MKDPQLWRSLAPADVSAVAAGTDTACAGWAHFASARVTGGGTPYVGEASLLKSAQWKQGGGGAGKATRPRGGATPLDDAVPPTKHACNDLRPGDTARDASDASGGFRGAAFPPAAAAAAAAAAASAAAVAVAATALVAAPSFAGRRRILSRASAPRRSAEASCLPSRPSGPLSPRRGPILSPARPLLRIPPPEGSLPDALARGAALKSSACGYPPEALLHAPRPSSSHRLTCTVAATLQRACSSTRSTPRRCYCRR
eukprot:358262-Chlamydomonas_euryale.AAC.15